MTAATNSAVDSSSTRRDEPRGRHDREVRQDREADDDPGDDPRREEAPGVVGSGEQAAARGGASRGRSGAPSAAPRTRM